MDLKLLTSSEVAEMLGVPSTWVETQARQGKIPKVPSLGKYVRFDSSVIHKLFFADSNGSFSTEYKQQKRKQSAS
jgi:excisionase family DNA binding protein